MMKFGELDLNSVADFRKIYDEIVSDEIKKMNILTVRCIELVV